MKYCDLHCHSVFSDGSNTPKELLTLAKEKELFAIALCDHNTISGLYEMEKCAKELNQNVILSSELTCEYNGKEIHMQCMFIDLNHTQGIENYINNIRRIKRERNIDMSRRLIADGYNVSLEELENRFGNNINRAHFALKLVEMGALNTVSEGFETLLKEGGKYYKPDKRPEALELISSIVSWGCVPVLAHPLLSLDRDELEEFLSKAKGVGLVGMEVYYPKFSKEQTEYLKTLAKRFDLILSGGSDYHGSVKANIALGSASVPYSCYEELLKASIKIKQKQNLGH